ncbi:MAG: amidophosphoribosyltransferase [Tremellales sp. Tagirdzhanova-0007]|nr:MAG: amidophosphoribosyltransferase [Tremellales sp. Tagirdzhanova-0007]
MEFAGKVVMLVDDSIVRGTTSREIIQMAKDAGARKVVMASCAPPIRFSNVYGIDMPSPLELVAHGRTEEEVAEHIGADLVIYQTLPDLIESCRQCNPSIQTFDCSVFTGEYVTGGVDERYLEHLEKLRNDKAKTKKMENGVQEAQMLSESCNGPMNGSDCLIGLPNHSPKIGPVMGMPAPIGVVGLHNSWYDS